MLIENIYLDHLDYNYKAPYDEKKNSKVKHQRPETGSNPRPLLREADALTSRPPLIVFQTLKWSNPASLSPSLQSDPVPVAQMFLNEPKSKQKLTG